MDYIVDLDHWPLLVLIEHCPHTRGVQMETARGVRTAWCSGFRSVWSHTFRISRALVYGGLRWVKWAPWTAHLPFPVLKPVWSHLSSSLFIATSWLVVLHACKHLSQLGVSSCASLIYLTGTELSPLPWFPVVSLFFIHHPCAYCLAPCFSWYHPRPPCSVLYTVEIFDIWTACSVYMQSLHVNKYTFTTFW